MARELLSVEGIQLRWRQTLDQLSSHRFNIVLISFGIILRLKLYLANNSFRLDESWLALDISTRTFAEIISAKIFSYDLPTVPPGFALIEKSFITLFGNNEYSFRLFPLLCGIASLFLFYGLLRKFVSGRATTIALAFFVCSDILIYHSSQLKQYSSGVFAALLLYHLMARMDSLKTISIRSSIEYGIAGGIAITLFYPSVFILAGIGITQITVAFYNKEWQRFRSLMFSAFLWLMIFVIVYAVYCRYMFYNGILSRGISSYPVWSLGNLRLLFELFTRMFLVKAAGLVPFWLGIYFILAGLVSLMQRNKKIFFALALPVLFVFLTVALKGYPTKSRFFVVFLPGIFIIFAQGVIMTMRSKKKVPIVFNGALLCLLLVHPIKTAVHSFRSSYYKEEIRPLMMYLKQYQKEGDALYMNNSTHYVYSYYSGYCDFDHKNKPVKKISDDLYEDEYGTYVLKKPLYFLLTESGYPFPFHKQGDVSKVRKDALHPFGDNKRTWIVFSYAQENTKKFVLSLLDQKGRKLRELELKGCSLYLYDLSSER